MARTPKAVKNNDHRKSTVTPSKASTSSGSTSAAGKIAKAKSTANAKQTSASKAKGTRSKQSTPAKSKTSSKKSTGVEEPPVESSSDTEDQHQNDPQASSSSEAEDSDWDEPFPRIFRRRFRGATPPPMPGYRHGGNRMFCDDDGGSYEILTLKDVDPEYRHLLKKYF